MYTLQPLPTKYYRTTILKDDKAVIDVYCPNGDYNPSQRELDAVGITLEQWQQDKEAIGPDHYERQSTLELALKIIKGLNN
jgi:hypothetical protein